MADPASSFYAESKREAEKLVDLVSNELSTITIRPRGIFGPGDTSILPRLIDALEQKRLPLIGDGVTQTNLTYIDNAVDALQLAIEAPDSLSGRKFNITDGPAVNLWDSIGLICDELGLDHPKRQISFDKAFQLAGALEWIHRWLLFGKEPRLTRYTVGLLARSQTLSIEAARKDLGFEPKVSTREGLLRFVEWWKSREK